MVDSQLDRSLDSVIIIMFVSCFFCAPTRSQNSAGRMQTPQDQACAALRECYPCWLRRTMLSCYSGWSKHSRHKHSVTHSHTPTPKQFFWVQCCTMSRLRDGTDATVCAFNTGTHQLEQPRPVAHMPRNYKLFFAE